MQGCLDHVELALNNHIQLHTVATRQAFSEAVSELHARVAKQWFPPRALTEALSSYLVLDPCYRRPVITGPMFMPIFASETVNKFHGFTRMGQRYCFEAHQRWAETASEEAKAHYCHELHAYGNFISAMRNEVNEEWFPSAWVRAELEAHAMIYAAKRGAGKTTWTI